MAIATVVVAIISAVVSVATAAVNAGLEGAAADASTIEGRKRLAEEEKRRKRAEKQDTRETNLVLLDRQRNKRAGAGITARQVPGAKPISRGLPTSSTRGGTPSLDITSGAGVAAKPVTPLTGRGDLTADQGEAIGKSAKIAGDVATGVLGAVGAAAGERAKEEEQAGIDKLQGAAFERALAKRKKGVDIKGLDFQEAQLAGPATSASHKSSFSTDFMKALREQSGRFQPGKVA